MNSYNQLVEALFGLCRDMAQATGDSDVIRRARALNAFSSAKEDYSMQRAILSAALANPTGPRLNDSDRYVVRAAFRSEKSTLAQFVQTYGPNAKELTEGIEGGVGQIRDAERFRERAMNSEKGIRAGDQSYLDWIDKATAKFNAMDTNQDRLLNQLEH